MVFAGFVDKSTLLILYEAQFSRVFRTTPLDRASKLHIFIVIFQRKVDWIRILAHINHSNKRIYQLLVRLSKLCVKNEVLKSNQKPHFYPFLIGPNRSIDILSSCQLTWLRILPTSYHARFAKKVTMRILANL